MLASFALVDFQNILNCLGRSKGRPAPSLCRVGNLDRRQSLIAARYQSLVFHPALPCIGTSLKKLRQVPGFCSFGSLTPTKRGELILPSGSNEVNPTAPKSTDATVDKNDNNAPITTPAEESRSSLTCNDSCLQQRVRVRD